MQGNNFINQAVNQTYAPSRQKSLFPLDPWGAEHVVVVFERPAPGISRAMVAPLALGDLTHQRDGKLLCLAAMDDGDFAASLWVSQEHLKTPNDLWSQVNAHLSMSLRTPVPIFKTGWAFIPEDCLEVLTSMGFWIPSKGDPCIHSIRAMSNLLVTHELRSKSCLTPTDRIQIEAQAQATVEAQIYSGVRYVLNALTPHLLEILTYRPRLSLSLASQLLSMAEQHGSSAVGYAIQALRTESLGLLHLITSGHPKKEANLVREAIFSGSSLPNTLLSLGITKAAHRQSICTPNRQNALTTPAETTLSDLPLSGDNWLAVMRHTKHLPLNRQEDWSDFCQLMTKLLAMNIQQEKIPLKLLNVCSQPNFKKSCQRLHAIVSKARLFARSANNLSNMHLVVDDNMPKAIALVTKAWDIHGNAPELGTSAHLDQHNFGKLMFGVSQLSGKSMNQLWGSILNMHPGIPNGFITPRGIYLQELNSIDFAQLHGIECENCLESIPVIGQYVTKGFALYGVRNVSGAQGTIALHYDAHRVCVAEVGGVNDENARPNIHHIAQSLADAWNKEPHAARWVSYANQCAAWRRLALACLD